MELTSEQKLIINSSGNIKINAVAGSGKTTTLIEYAKKCGSSKKILYLAFNRSVKQEAIRKFSRANLNVDVQTPHSLAFRNIVFSNNYTVSQGYKRHEVAEILKINRKGSTGYLLAGHIMAYADYFCANSEEKVSDLDYIKTIKSKKACQFAKAFLKEITIGTRELLAKMNRGDISVTHGFYLKKFQLTKPKLNYDIILFDEGQDASPVMLDIFNIQNAQKAIVGDVHQQIYRWRYAVNALQQLPFKEYNLSVSFRFDDKIAGLARKVISWKKYIDESYEIKIVGKGRRLKMHKTNAFLARTNLALFSAAIEMVFEEQSINTLYFEGNINSYTYASEGASLFDVLNLYQDKRKFIRDPIVASMASFSDLCKYADEQDDPELGTIIELVRKYGKSLPYYIKKLREIHVDEKSREKADMIFSTVHRCKGMEYDSVTLADDFISEESIKKQIEKEVKDGEDKFDTEKLDEEINLLYVALTRSSSELLIPATLIDNVGSRFKLKEKKKNEFKLAFPKQKSKKGRKKARINSRVY